MGTLKIFNVGCICLLIIWLKYRGNIGVMFVPWWPIWTTVNRGLQDTLKELFTMSITVHLKRIYNLPGKYDRKVELSFRGKWLFSNYYGWCCLFMINVLYLQVFFCYFFNKICHVFSTFILQPHKLSFFLLYLVYHLGFTHKTRMLDCENIAIFNEVTYLSLYVVLTLNFS